jgi:hypothetical protein
MPEATYYVALPFVASDDGSAPGEAVVCFNPNAPVIRAEGLRKERVMSARSRTTALVNPLPAISARPRSAGSSAMCPMI